MRYYLTRNNNNDNYDIFNAFNDLFKPVFYNEGQDLRTDIEETDSTYELKMEMPGYEKEQIKVTLEDGYLTVSAAKEKSEEEDKKRYLRREIAESCRRSFYVGKNLTEEQIKAKYENGILRLTVPKNAPKQVQSRAIAIE